MAVREKLLFENVSNKSFLIEILYPDGDIESFAFSLPPENIEITMSQRITETKTFGGVFIDDYGHDIGKIHLAGSTGNGNIKRIYRGKKPETWLTGKEEIYYLRDKIIRYKESDKWKRQETAAIINIYNLSASYTEDGKNEDENTYVDAWEVILKDFKIIQSKDKPFISNYSIDFTAIRIIGESNIKDGAAPVAITSSQRDAESTIKTANEQNVVGVTKKTDDVKDVSGYKKLLNTIEKFYGISKDVKNSIQKFRNTVSIYTGEVERYLAMVTGSIDNYMEAAAGLVYTAADVYNVFNRVTLAPAELAERLVNTAKNMRRTIEATIEDIQNLPDEWSDAYGGSGRSTESEIAAYKETFDSLMCEVENKAFRSYTEAVSSANPVAIMVPKTGEFDSPANNDETDIESDITGMTAMSAQKASTASGIIDVVVAYGFRRETATSETKLEILAEKYLGDPDKAQVLAIMNGISGDDEINPGDQIKIPILSENTTARRNFIFGPPNRRDAPGIDIAIKDGIIQAGPGGDFELQYDAENINQAINMRLSESIGRRLRLSTYGIRNVAGMKDSVAIAYLATSIKDTVIQDPRIESVENIRVRGKADMLAVRFDYYTYDGERMMFEGRI
jgi:hypothetical protein